MGKSILYKLFGLGRIPKRARPALEAEGIELSDEGIGGWCTTRNFKSPRRRTLYRKEGFTGSLVITKKRVIFFTFGRRQINLPIDDPKMAVLHAEVIRPGALCLSFDAAEFHDGWRGTMEFSLKTDMALDFLERLMALGVQPGAVGSDG